METKLFYRVANNKTEQGLWYDFNGNFTGLIHNDFNFCMSNKLPMPFDPEIVGWLSATETLDELFNWFSQEDIAKLENYGFEISIYEATEFKYHNNHWIIKQDSARFKERVPMAFA